MSDTNTSHYKGALLEDIKHKLDVMLEYSALLSDLPSKVDRINERLQRVESDVKDIKRIVAS